MAHFNMKLTILCILALITFSSTSFAKKTSNKPNILLICVDDLRPELGCYGKDHMHTPHMDSLAQQGRLFSRHYVQAPTCGISRFSLLTGTYPRTPSLLKNSVMHNLSKKNALPPTLPQVFKENGYTTIAVGKISHYPGGLVGKEWNNPKQVELLGAWTKSLMPCGEWKTPKKAMHGIAGGIARVRGKTPAIEIKEGPDTIYPDGLITNTAVEQLSELGEEKKPWFLAVGLIKPHLPFTAPKKYWDLYEDKKLPAIANPNKPTRNLTWHRSPEFFGSYSHSGKKRGKDTDYAAHVRRHYYASVSYADAQIGKILSALEQSGQQENTIIVLWGDHGWNLGERSIWGKHNLYEEALHAPLIIRMPHMKHAGIPANAITETCDIFPTLCELSGLKAPKGLDGTSLTAQLKKPEAPTDGLAVSFWRNSQSLRTDQYRLTRYVKDGKTDYNLFLFPEDKAPDQQQVLEVTKTLSDKFVNP